MMNLAPQKHRISVSEWQKMGKYDIFPPDARMELIEGEIIDMAPIGPSHAGCVRHFIELFIFNSERKNRTYQRTKSHRTWRYFRINARFNLVVPAAHFYRERHPTAEDIFLLIEVSDTTVQHDREEKIPIYAKDGIVECWLVDLNEFQVEVYLNPTANGYANKRIFESEQTLIPSQLPHIKIPVFEILNP